MSAQNSKIISRDSNGNTALHRAVMTGDWLEVDRLTSRSVAHPIDALNAFLETPLCVAIKEGKVKCIEVLLRKGADVTIKANSSRGLLQAAASSTMLKNEDFNVIVDKLVEKGVDIDAVDASGFTALLKACFLYQPEKDLPKLQKLIEIGCNPTLSVRFSPVVEKKPIDFLKKLDPVPADCILLLEDYMARYAEEQNRWQRMKSALVVMDSIKRDEFIPATEVSADASASEKAMPKNAAAFLDVTRWLEQRHRAVQKLVLDFI
ncbi:MAG: ankyrin repeat domain-containing protein [Gammaproteobacteria bacterium]|nr:ankyrin repeat domain-containing protein [Gammaproteobacteria bacterium]